MEGLEPRLLLSALPIMHSNPGAPLALFLDFDGGTVFGTYRGPYDRDGNPTDFNATEITQITNCWKDITAMFSMFDVDVTTEQPDVYNQTTAWNLITPDTPGGASNTNMLPNLIARSSNNQNNATGRTTGITHEFGHNIRLNHQKTFDAAGNVVKDYRPALNNVGAIMGVDYAGAFAQWWLGHGVAADGLQDDIQAIVSAFLEHAPVDYTGDGFAEDDYAGDLNDPTANATYLTGTTSWSAQGVIERMTDTDLFSFDWSGGHITVGASNRYSAAYAHYMSSVGLDVRVFDSSGDLVGFDGATTDSDVSYSVTMNLPAGRYYAAFSTFGNYADLGSYDVSIVSASDTGLAAPKAATAGMDALMAVDASSNLTSQVKLRLDNPDPSSQSVIVERSTNGVNWSSIYTSSTYAASRVITDSVSPATKYLYRYGIQSSGVYHYSSPLEVGTYSSTVSGLTITTLAATSKQVLDWADNYRDSGYAVAESVDGGAYVQIATTGTNFNMFVRPQEAGHTYAYQVTGLAGNWVPTAVADSGSTSYDQPVVLSFSSLLGNDSDPDGDTVTLIDASDAPHGTVTINSSTGEITYTPDSGYGGSDWFNYRIADGQGNYAIATVTIDVELSVTTMTSTSVVVSNDNWNQSANWSNGVPAGSTDVTINSSLAAKVSSASTPTWSGTLTLSGSSSLKVYNVAGSQNAVSGAGSISMGAATTIELAGNWNSTLPAISLTGASPTLFINNDWQTVDVNGAITGSYALTLKGFNGDQFHLNAADSFASLTAEATDRWIVQADAAGALGSGTVTVNRRSADNRSAVLVINVADAMGDTVDLHLNGQGWAGSTGGSSPSWVKSTYTRLQMNANDTVAELWIDGVQMSAGNYTGTSDTTDWIGGTGTLTVLNGPEGMRMLPQATQSARKISAAIKATKPPQLATLGGETDDVSLLAIVTPAARPHGPTVQARHTLRAGQISLDTTTVLAEEPAAESGATGRGIKPAKLDVLSLLSLLRPAI